MTAYYRNRETGIIQAHPVSGIGDSLNSDEVGVDAKPIVPLGTSKKDAAKIVDLGKKSTDATGGKSADGETKTQEGAH